MSHVTRNNRLTLIFAAVGLVLCVAPAFAQESVADPPLQIDIPTRLEKANVVIDFGHAVFAGDMLFALGDIDLLAK